MNFNGQLKKRNVNLGGGFKNNRAALLLQAQREREKRGQDRNREKSVILIQKSIRQFLEYTKFQLSISEKWLVETDNSTKSDINSIVFQFNIFFSGIFKHIENAERYLDRLLEHLNSDSIVNLTLTNRKRLFETTSLTLAEAVADGSTNLVIDDLLRLADLVYSTSLLSSHFKIIPSLIRVLEQDSNSYKLVISLIDRYGSIEGDEYLKFLANHTAGTLRDLHVNSQAISSVFKKYKNDFNISNVQKIDILALLIKDPRPLTKERITAIAYLTSQIDVSVYTASEDRLVDDDNIKGSEKYIVSNEINEVIEVLYTRQFIAESVKLLDDLHVASLLYGSLIRFKPTLKLNFITYLIPAIFGTFTEHVLSHDAFQKLLDLPEERLFSASDDLLKSLLVDNHYFLHYDLQVYFELLQYRLITSNDVELFIGYGFTIEKFKALAIFLKKLVFLSIWDSSRIEKLVTNIKSLKTLKDVTIKVLTQVYLKDSRLEVIGKELWIIDPQKLDLNNLVSIISDYESSKKELNYDSDDESGVYSGTLARQNQAKFEIYQKIPFFISFEKRVEIFQLLIELDRERFGVSTTNNFNFFSQFIERKQKATIRREHLLEDAYESFHSLGKNFKSKLEIVFESENGVEQGIDGGGLTKELLTSVVKEGFDDLFVENYNHELYPNPQIGLRYQYRIDSEEQLKKINYTNFLGKIIGKCLYERVLVDVTFPAFFLTKFNTGFKSSFDDLKSLDSELYSNLVKLLTLSEEELDSLNLTFTVDERLDKKNITIDLIPNGSLTNVNISNRLKFIHEVSNYKLNKMINLQCNAFLTGLYEIISREWLSMFNPYELRKLISGDTEIDIEDLKEHTHYGGYSSDDQTILQFWEVVESMSSRDKSQLVKFVTSVPRAPLLGFKALVPNFGINNITTSNSDRLPTSSTCVNLLNLPNYRDREVLKQKLLYAINADAGFDLA